MTFALAAGWPLNLYRKGGTGSAIFILGIFKVLNEQQLTP
jgi:hypothetical protein